MADAIIKQAAIERSLDNLTIVIVSFANLQEFLNDRPKPVRPENHLFQIKEVESCATSVVIQSTPGLNNMSATPKEDMKNSIPEVHTEEFEHTPKRKSED